MQRLGCGEGGGELPAHKRQSVQYSTLVGPSFLNSSVHAHAHAPIGQTAYLTCIVRNLHNYTVSWVRARDIHLLTAGETTYTSDHRFVAVNPGRASGGAADPPRQGLRRRRLPLPSVRHAAHLYEGDAAGHRGRAVRLGRDLLASLSSFSSLSRRFSSPRSLFLPSLPLLLVPGTQNLYPLCLQPRAKAEAKVRPGTEVFLKVGSRVVLLCEVQGCPYPALPTWYRGQEVLEDAEVEEGSVLPPLSTPLPPPTNTPKPVAEKTCPPLRHLQTRLRTRTTQFEHELDALQHHDAHARRSAHSESGSHPPASNLRVAHPPPLRQPAGQVLSADRRMEQTPASPAVPRFRTTQ
ncbi:putative cell adhesion molecule 2-like [Penaeus vannamei]|uniref:Putative cell adhesion molecule 2-like n=1 Tax=Penaeus vannamei TaxID=6689 RepID=A0A3R7N744_PENVA|nr:putative cell adhesion molecule 2-like [Penaeus vannamei]